MSLNKSRDWLSYWVCWVLLGMVSCELVCQTAILTSILLNFLRIWNRNLAIPVSTTKDDFPSIQNEHGLVQRDHREIILKQHWTKGILIKLLLLLSTSKGCKWVQIIRLVDPHIKSHFAINPCCSNQSFIDELGLDDSLPLNRWQSSLLNLAENGGFVIILLVLLLVDGPVYFQIGELVRDQIIFENLFFILFGWVLFCPELNHICWSLSIIVHL